MKFERFTDGVAKIYAVANIADAGDRPVDGLKLKYRLCYQYKTVGVKRFVEAQQIFMQVDEMIYFSGWNQFTEVIPKFFQIHRFPPTSKD